MSASRPTKHPRPGVWAGYAQPEAVVSTWLPEHLAEVEHGPATTPDVIDPDRLHRMLPGRFVWDPWPLLDVAGHVARPFGREFWIAPSTPDTLDQPGQRHDRAVLWLSNANSFGQWVGEVELFADSQPMGSRQWAGCALLDATSGVVTVLYTAVGEAGEQELTFTQRIVGTRGRLAFEGDMTRAVRWEAHRELFTVTGELYKPPARAVDAAGSHDSLRHPALFRDPSDARRYLLFSATMADADTRYNACIGIARQMGDGLHDWQIMPPLLTADGVVRSLERPHVVERFGTYYLFATVHDRALADGIEAPQGLYGWWAPSLFGPYEPLNGSGLVIGNPPDEHAQASSWQVLRDGWVVSSAAYTGLEGRRLGEVAADDPTWMRGHYAGTIAPWLRLSLSREGTRIAEQRYSPPLWE